MPGIGTDLENAGLDTTPAPAPTTPGAGYGSALEDPVGSTAKAEVDRGSNWTELSRRVKEFGGNPDDYAHLQKHLDLREVQKKVASEGGESTATIYRRKYMPFGDVVGTNFLPDVFTPSGRSRVVGNAEYQDAKARFDAGTHTEGDLDAIARFERGKATDVRADKEVTLLGNHFAGKLALELGSLGKITGEMLPAGRVGSALALPGRVATAAKGGAPLLPSAPGLFRAGTEAPSLLRQAAGQLPSLAATTTLSPSMWVPQMQEANVRGGRNANDIRGMPTAFGYGMANLAVLGRLQRGGEGSLNPITLFTKGVLGMAELQGVDLAAGAVDQFLPKAYQIHDDESRFGTLGSIVRPIMKGDRAGVEDALEHATVQALSFSAFGAIHSAVEGKPPKDSETLLKTYTNTVADLRSKGATREEAGKTLSELHTTLEGALKAEPYMSREEAYLTLTDASTRAGKFYELNDYATKLALTFEPKERMGPPAPPEGGPGTPPSPTPTPTPAPKPPDLHGPPEPPDTIEELSAKVIDAAARLKAADEAVGLARSKGTTSPEYRDAAANRKTLGEEHRGLVRKLAEAQRLAAAAKTPPVEVTPEKGPPPPESPETPPGAPPSPAAPPPVEPGTTPPSGPPGSPEAPPAAPTPSAPTPAPTPAPAPASSGGFTVGQKVEGRFGQAGEVKAIFPDGRVHIELGGADYIAPPDSIRKYLKSEAGPEPTAPSAPETPTPAAPGGAPAPKVPGAGGPPARPPHAEAVVNRSRAALDANPRLSPEQRKVFGDAFQRVVEGLPKAARDAMNRNVKDVKFFPDHVALSEDAAREWLARTDLTDAQRADWQGTLDEALAGRETAVGNFNFRSGTLRLDGSAVSGGQPGRYPSAPGGKPVTAEQIYAHEFGHTVDGLKLSTSGEWMMIARSSEIGQRSFKATLEKWLAEGMINGKPLSAAQRKHYEEQLAALNDPPLTRYAQTDFSESFAEFYRLVHSGDVPHAQIERDFPRATKFFRDKGLWPEDAKLRRGPETPPTEVFTTKVGPDENHLDVSEAQRLAAAAERAASPEALSEFESEPRGHEPASGVTTERVGDLSVESDGEGKTTVRDEGGKEIGSVSISYGGATETPAARRGFKGIVGPTETAARLHGIEVADEHRGRGIGQFLLLRGLSDSKADWLYNSQISDDGVRALEALARKGWIDLRWRVERGGTFVTRITEAGRKALEGGRVVRPKSEAPGQPNAPKAGGTSGPVPMATGLKDRLVAAVADPSKHDVESLIKEFGKGKLSADQMQDLAKQVLEKYKSTHPGLKSGTEARKLLTAVLRGTAPLDPNPSKIHTGESTAPKPEPTTEPTTGGTNLDSELSEAESMIERKRLRRDYSGLSDEAAAGTKYYDRLRDAFGKEIVRLARLETDPDKKDKLVSLAFDYHMYMKDDAFVRGANESPTQAALILFDNAVSGPEGGLDKGTRFEGLAEEIRRAAGVAKDSVAAAAKPAPPSGGPPKVKSSALSKKIEALKSAKEKAAQGKTLPSEKGATAGEEVSDAEADRLAAEKKSNLASKVPASAEERVGELIKEARNTPQGMAENIRRSDRLTAKEREILAARVEGNTIKVVAGLNQKSESTTHKNLNDAAKKYGYDDLNHLMADVQGSPESEAKYKNVTPDVEHGEGEEPKGLMRLSDRTPGEWAYDESKRIEAHQNELDKGGIAEGRWASQHARQNAEVAMESTYNGEFENANRSHRHAAQDHGDAAANLRTTAQRITQWLNENGPEPRYRKGVRENIQKMLAAAAMHDHARKSHLRQAKLLEDPAYVEGLADKLLRRFGQGDVDWRDVEDDLSPRELEPKGLLDLRGDTPTPGEEAAMESERIKGEHKKLSDEHTVGEGSWSAKMAVKQSLEAIDHTNRAELQSASYRHKQAGQFHEEAAIDLSYRGSGLNRHAAESRASGDDAYLKRLKEAEDKIEELRQAHEEAASKHRSWSEHLEDPDNHEAVLDKLLARKGGGSAQELDWRPNETIPEDFYGMLDLREPIEKAFGALKEKAGDSKKSAAKFFFGGLPESIRSARVQEIDTQIAAHAFDVANAEKDFRAALKATGKPYEKLSDDELSTLNDILSTDPATLATAAAAAGVSPQVADVLLRMRKSVDGLSQDLIDTGAIDGPVVAQIEAQVGTYLTRQYRVFKDPKWYEKVEEGVKNTFKSWLHGELVKEYGKTEADKADLEAEMRSLLVDGTAAENPIAFLSSSRLGSKDLSILKTRKEIPPELRALWGEYTDPLVNYTNSVAKMAHLLTTHQFLRRVAAEGKGTLFFDAPTGEAISSFKEAHRPGSLSTMTKGAGAKMGALADKYMTPEVKAAFEEAFAKRDLPDYMRAYMKALSAAKLSKVVFSPTGQLRNFLSNIGLAVRNGYFSTDASLVESFRALAKDTDQSRHEWRKMIELGIVGEEINYRDFAATLEDAFSSREGPSLGSNVVGRFFSGGKDFAEKLYRYGDSFWKVYAFKAEVARYQKAYPSESREVIERKAAEIVRDTMPTYSKIAEWLQKLRRLPIIAPFISFQAEVVRTTKNNLLQAWKEMKDPATRSIGAQRLAGTLAAAAVPVAVAAWLRSLQGISDEQEEAVRKFLPDSQKQSLLFFTGRDDKGRPEFIDASRTDPHSYLMDATMAFVREAGKGNVAKGLADAGSELSRPFTQEELLVRPALDIARNQKEPGGQVYNPADSTLEQGKDVARAAIDPFVPGGFGSARRLVMSATGATEQKTGEGYELPAALKENLTGQRFESVKVEDKLKSAAIGYGKTNDDAAKISLQMVKAQGEVSQNDLLAAAARTTAGREAAYRDLKEKVEAAQRLHMSDGQIAKLLKDAGVSQDDVISLLRGTTPRPYRPQLEGPVQERQRAADVIRANVADYRTKVPASVP